MQCAANKLAYQKTYRAKNREAIAAQNKQWKLDNKEAINARNKQRLDADPDLAERKREYQRKWYADNYKGKPNSKAKSAQRRERYATDPNYKTRQRIHSDMYKVTRGILKSGKMFALLGCTLDELSAHIEAQFEEGMSFDNLGQWELDHVKPLHTFDLTDEAQLQTACHYSNTRPLWRQDNRRYQT